MSTENRGGIISIAQILIRPPELSGNPTRSHLIAKQEELAIVIINLTYEASLFIFRNNF
jgi:hypothetical protein